MEHTGMRVSRGARRYLGVGLVVVALCLAACGDDDDTAQTDTSAPPAAADLDGTDWVLVGVGDSDTAPTGTMTLRIAADAASGSGPCNSYQMPFEVSGTEVTTGPVASTEMACAPAILDEEGELFAALEGVDTAQVEGDQLVLTGADGVRLVFDPPADVSEAIQGSWDIVNVATADAITSVIVGTRPTLGFAESGTLAIDGGCNTGRADWTADGDTFTITGASTTQMACADPEGVMDQEAAIFAALDRVASAEVTADQATLYDEDGLIVLELASRT